LASDLHPFPGQMRREGHLKSASLPGQLSSSGRTVIVDSFIEVSRGTKRVSCGFHVDNSAIPQKADVGKKTERVVNRSVELRRSEFIPDPACCDLRVDLQ
jgi:hypothetical protein